MFCGSDAVPVVVTALGGGRISGSGLESCPSVGAVRGWATDSALSETDDNHCASRDELRELPQVSVIDS